MWTSLPLSPGIIWEIPTCVSSALQACQEEDPRKRPGLRALLDDAEWQHVAGVRKKYMRWEAEDRLRRRSWYAYHVNFRGGVEPEYQWFTQLLKTQICDRGRGSGAIAAEEWCAADAD